MVRDSAVKYQNLSHLNNLAVDLVRPSTVVPKCSGRFDNVEGLGSAESFAVVESFKRSKDIKVPLHQLGNLNEVLSSLETGDAETPRVVESIVGDLDGLVNVGLQSLGNFGKDLACSGVVDAGRTLDVMDCNGQKTQAHSMVLAFLSTEEAHSPLIKIPVGTSTLPL